MLKAFFRHETTTPVDPLIDAVLEEMHNVGVNSDEYPKLMAYLERLNEVKAKDRRDPVSRDTLAYIFGALANTLFIVAYEQKHVWTSKAFVPFRPRNQGNP